MHLWVMNKYCRKAGCNLKIFVTVEGIYFTTFTVFTKSCFCLFWQKQRGSPDICDLCKSHFHGYNNSKIKVTTFYLSIFTESGHKAGGNEKNKK